MAHAQTGAWQRFVCIEGHLVQSIGMVSVGIHWKFISGCAGPRERIGRVAELADALDLGSSAARCAGSSPASPTIQMGSPLPRSARSGRARCHSIVLLGRGLRRLISPSFPAQDSEKPKYGGTKQVIGIIACGVLAGGVGGKKLFDNISSGGRNPESSPM